MPETPYLTIDLDRVRANFLALQGELSGTEDKIAYARQFYNSAVQTLNAAVQSIPTNIVAGMGHFKEREFFQVSAPAEREAPKVSFGTTGA